MANDSLCFLEQTDFSLLLARGAAGSSPLRLEALQEVPLADPAALAAAVRAVFAAEPAAAVCALRPKPRRLHLAGAEESRRHPGLGGARQVASAAAALSSLPPAWLAATAASDGTAAGATPWLAALTSAEGQAATSTLLDSLAVKPTRRVSATLNTAGAIATSITAPIWLLEIGELGSSALLISRDGVHAAGAVSLNLDRIAEAVQSELGLKFRGSAVKLFFNPVYDYNEVGPKIAGRVAAALKAELTTLRGANPAPIALACTGLPAAQQWFTTQLAAALELAAFVPEAKTAGLAFATPELEASVSPAWFGFLRLAATVSTGAPAPWEADWLKLDTIALPVAPKPPAPMVVAAPPPPAPVAPPAPKPAAPKPAAPVPVPFPLPDAPAPRPAVAATVAAAAVATPAAAAVIAAPKPIAPKPAAPAPVPVPAPVTAKVAAAAPAAPKPASAVSYSPKPATPEKPAAQKKPTPPPPVTLPVNTLPMAELPPSQPFFKNKVALAVVALVLVLGVGGYFFVSAQQQEAARLKEEKARTEQRLQAEIAKTRVIEEKAQAETEARKKAEAESARKLAEAEAGRQRAESDARSQAAARLANARGALTIATDPAGATITVGNLAPRPSPATYTDLKIGKYPVTIALNLYDTAQLELEVKEDATTDTGVIKLNKILGSLELITEPASVAYEVKPANAMIVLPEARRTGRTPATLADLIPGDYTVTFVRDGWMPQVENVTIIRDEVAHVKGMFPNGIVKISSKPAGAIVTREGVRVGVTPLILNDQLPGDVSYMLNLRGYAPEPASGHIVGGQTLEISPALELIDHISKLGELDQPPKVLTAVQPQIPYEFRRSRRSAEVRIELTITRDGSTKDLLALPGSERALIPACLTAAAQWKFRPGSKNGRNANVRMIIPFNIEASE